MAGNITCLNQATQLLRQWLTMPAMKLNPELVQIIMYYGRSFIIFIHRVF